MGRPKKELPNRKDGTYGVKITVGKTFEGKLIRKSFYSSKSKADARLKAEEYKIKMAVAEQTGEQFISKSYTFNQWADKWLNVIKDTVTDSTYNGYEVAVRLHLKPYFQNARIIDIKQIDVQQYINKISKEIPRESVMKYKNCLNAIFEMAVDNDICYKNPCNNIKITTQIETDKKQTYTQEQTDLILEYAKTHKYGLEISILLEYGLRRGELLGLRWEDIDFGSNILHIRKSVADIKNKDTGKIEVIIKEPKNKYSIREVPISVEISSRLKETYPNDSIYVFPNSIGGLMSPHNWTNRHYKVFMEDMQQYYHKQGIDIPILNPHELRHTRATLWVNSGMNLFAVASILGHGDLKMLRERYAHSDTESIRKSLNI